MASLVEHGPKYALFKKSVWSVVNQLKQQGNVWDKYALHERPAERVRRHRYDAESETWKEDLVLFKVSDGAFDEGAMRRCFRAKKNAFGHVIRFHALDWKRGSNYIVKEYKTPPDVLPDRRAFDDVKWQSEAGLWAADYNRSRPPKPIKMIQCCAVEFVDRPGRPVYCAERFIDGTDAFGDTFVKHNTNSGWTDTNQQRLTPEAFSAHSFYASRGDVLVCDIQGVGDLFTDPQLHSCDESHGDGDLGRRGMALFFASSDGSNELMKLLEIPAFALTAAERRRAARAAAPAKARSPSRRSSAIRTVALPKKPETVSDRDAKRSENAYDRGEGRPRPRAERHLPHEGPGPRGRLTSRDAANTRDVSGTPALARCRLTIHMSAQPGAKRAQGFSRWGCGGRDDGGGGAAAGPRLIVDMAVVCWRYVPTVRCSMRRRWFSVKPLSPRGCGGGKAAAILRSKPLSVSGGPGCSPRTLLPAASRGGGSGAAAAAGGGAWPYCTGSASTSESRTHAGAKSSSSDGAFAGAPGKPPSSKLPRKNSEPRSAASSAASSAGGAPSLSDDAPSLSDDASSLSSSVSIVASGTEPPASSRQPANHEAQSSGW